MVYSIQNNSAEKEFAKDCSLKWCSVSLKNIVSHSKRLGASVFDVAAKHDSDAIINRKYTCARLLGENELIEKAYYSGRFIVKKQLRSFLPF